MNLKVLRLAGFFGLVAPFFGFGMVFLSIWVSPWFSWTGNALSDLGAEGFGSILFNMGLPMTAALMMMFGTGLYEMMKGDTVGQIGCGSYLLGCVFLIGIGVANITIEPWHWYMSVGFFVTMPLSVAVIGLFCFRRRMRFYSLLAWGTALLAAGIWFLPWSAVAMPEALSAAYVSVWMVLQGYWMYTRKEDKLEG